MSFPSLRTPSFAHSGESVLFVRISPVRISLSNVCRKLLTQIILSTLIKKPKISLSKQECQTVTNIIKNIVNTHRKENPWLYSKDFDRNTEQLTFGEKRPKILVSRHFYQRSHSSQANFECIRLLCLKWYLYLFSLMCLKHSLANFTFACWAVLKWFMDADSHSFEI